MRVEAKHINKYKSRSVSWLIQTTHKYFNKYIRLRDSEDGRFTCISCQENKPTSQMNAGHFRSTGHFGCLRFTEDNCHGQCVKCNNFLGGNLYEYSKHLKEKIGADAFERLDSGCNGRFKWDRIELIELLIAYQSKSKG